MKFRRMIFLTISIMLGGAFLFLLVHLGKVNLRETWQMIRRVSALNFAELMLLNALLVGLSTMKWRITDAVLRRPDDAIPSRLTTFFVSSMGMGLGLILPVQLGMTTARTLGTRTYGRTLKRGGVGTVFEQSFDLLVVVALAGASFVTWIFHGGGGMWLACAAPLTLLVLLAVGPSIRLAKAIARRVPDLTAGPRPVWLPDHPYRWLGSGLRELLGLQHSGLLNERLARQMYGLSVIRYGVVILMAGQTARAIRAAIPLWQMGATAPFVTVANLIGVTPGGIGLSEFTAAGVLSMFGTPLALASQWALANRVLMVACCSAVVCLASLTLVIQKSLATASS